MEGHIFCLRTDGLHEAPHAAAGRVAWMTFALSCHLRCLHLIDHSPKRGATFMGLLIDFFPPRGRYPLCFSPRYSIALSIPDPGIVVLWKEHEFWKLATY